MTERKLGYNQLAVGHEFPPISFDLDPDSVAAYLRATSETDILFESTGNVPPTAVAAWALISLLEYIDLPDGTIHLSQEVQSNGTAREGQTLTCHARVSRKQERSRLKLLDIDFDVVDQGDKSILTGKSGFNLP